MPNLFRIEASRLPALFLLDAKFSRFGRLWSAPRTAAPDPTPMFLTISVTRGIGYERSYTIGTDDRRFQQFFHPPLKIEHLRARMLRTEARIISGERTTV
jgi:hypothetical protein